MIEPPPCLTAFCVFWIQLFVGRTHILLSITSKDIEHGLVAPHNHIPKIGICANMLFGELKALFYIPFGYQWFFTTQIGLVVFLWTELTYLRHNLQPFDFSFVWKTLIGTY